MFNAYRVLFFEVNGSKFKSSFRPQIQIRCLIGNTDFKFKELVNEL